MRPNSYVLVTSPNAEPNAEPLVGIIQAIITPQRFAVTINQVVVMVSRKDIERMKPRQRRNYRNRQRGN